MQVRELITTLRFQLAGLNQAQAAMNRLAASARSIPDIRLKVAGLGQAQEAIGRLRAAARGAIAVPVAQARAGGGLAPRDAPRIDTGNVREATGALDGLRFMAQAATGAMAGLAASFGVSALLKAGDAYTGAFNRLNAELEGTGETAQHVYEKLFATSRQTGVNIDAGVQAFTSLHNSVRGIGGTSEQVLSVIEGIQKAGTVSGASAGDVTEVMRQLSQSFNAGTLNGDELRILLERMGPLARELAKSLGVPAGQLKKLGSDGKLTVDKVFPALLKAVGAFNDKFERMDMTLERARGISQVVFTRFLADLDHAIDLTPTLARGLLRVSEWADGLRSRLPVVRAFVRDLGGITSVLETVAIAAGLATAAFFRFGLSLIVPAAVVLGITGVAVALQDLWYWVRGRPSVLGDFFGDFEPVRARIAAATEFAAAKFRELRAEVLQGLGFETTGEVIADVERRFVAFAETTRREWAAVRDAFTSDGATGLMGDTFRGLAASAEAMWAVVAPIIRGLVGGPAEMAREWANVRAAIGDPLKAVGAFFDDIATRAGNVYARLTELAGKMREFLGSIGLMNLTPGNGLPPDAVARARERDARGTEPFGPPAPVAPGAGPRAAPRPAIRDENGQPMYSPSAWTPNDYLGQLPGRMGRAQTIAANQANSIVQHISVTATGSDPAAVAAAAQSGVNRANRDAFGASETFARGLGLDMSRTELAAV